MPGGGEIMGQRKSRLTLGRLMAVIGIIALGFAMSRVDAAPAVSVCVFAACTWFLASRRYTEALARRTAEGVSVGRSQKARIAVRCTITAAFAIGLPDAAFLAGLYGYMAMMSRLAALNHAWRPDLEPEHILFGSVVGIVAALFVAEIMRRGLRPAAKNRPKAANRVSLRSTIEHRRVAAS
jgi:ABC-type amino acid transport system permease subunit